jgi:hypothetical protein
MWPAACTLLSSPQRLSAWAATGVRTLGTHIPTPPGEHRPARGAYQDGPRFRRGAKTQQVHHAPSQDLTHATAAQSEALSKLLPTVRLAIRPATVQLHERAISLGQCIKGSLWQRAQLVEVACPMAPGGRAERQLRQRARAEEHDARMCTH